MGRAISDNFYRDLKTGCLSDILKAVHNDTTLIMELRGKAVTIYYRGGALFTITEGTDGYSATYNSAYWKIKKKYPELTESPEIKDCVEKIALYKDQMDFHMANSKRTLEKQCQQNIVLENNILGQVSTEADGTTGDYFSLDIEYPYKDSEGTDARFDIVALNFPSTSSRRKKRDNLGISIVEVKYYDDAMRGNSGIQKHIKDYLNFIQSEEYHEMCRDMEKVFYQKCELGLIPSYTTRLKKDKRYYNITIDDSKVDFVFMFANRDPDSRKAKEELQESIKKFGKMATERIYVAVSSDVGYIMFRYVGEDGKDRYIPIEKYIQG